MKSSKLPYFFLGLSAVLAVSALTMLILRPRTTPKPTVAESVTSPAAPTASQEVLAPSPSDTFPSDPQQALDSLAPAVGAADASRLISDIGSAFEAGDFPKLVRLIGKDALTLESMTQLQALTAKPLRLQPLSGIRELGELTLNEQSRWMLTLTDPEGDTRQITLDLRNANGKWKIDQLNVIPRAPDSLDVADKFIQAVVKQDFVLANTLIDPKTVSDTKIAGLCILFEEGGYQMRKTKPLRAMYNRPDAVGYLAYAETVEGKQSAQFAVTLTRPAAEGPAGKWIISEINLDRLLADYASRIAGGDIYYTPLVKNPAGGDTLALYFDFNEDEMNPRTRRQLEIVNLILKSDPGKKITLSGHADALGTKDYNNQLSARRADVVRDFLIRAGVSADQIVTLAKGDSQPRRPNLTEAGIDNPDGRRANRRTEIYLDF
jgi:OmpA-OmpF porin, OOP family